jgi:hypothetical protein
MVPHRGLATVLLLVVLWAPAAAAASVPDPTWIGGLYDGADGDELVALVWDQSPGIAPPAIVLGSPRAVWSPPPPAPVAATLRCAAPPDSRAPPAS